MVRTGQSWSSLRRCGGQSDLQQAWLACIVCSYGQGEGALSSLLTSNHAKNASQSPAYKPGTHLSSSVIVAKRCLKVAR